MHEADIREDVREERAWWYQHLAEVAVANFRRRNLDAHYVPTKEEAFTRVMELIPEGATIAWGDSVTLQQIGVVTELGRTRRHLLIDPFERKADGSLVATGEARLELMRKGLTADVFLTGVNAITLDGKLVSTDATGNRVAAMIFGPKRVIVVAGANKIVKNLDEALIRVKEVVAPINSWRHFTKHHDPRFANLPCVRTGKCSDCFNEDRICRNTVIIEGEREPSTITGYIPRIRVIIVGEELGI